MVLLVLLQLKRMIWKIRVDYGWLSMKESGQLRCSEVFEYSDGEYEIDDNEWIRGIPSEILEELIEKIDVAEDYIYIEISFQEESEDEVVVVDSVEQWKNNVLMKKNLLNIKDVHVLERKHLLWAGFPVKNKWAGILVVTGVCVIVWLYWHYSDVVIKEAHFSYRISAPAPAPEPVQVAVENTTTKAPEPEPIEQYKQYQYKTLILVVGVWAVVISGVLYSYYMNMK